MSNDPESSPGVTSRIVTPEEGRRYFDEQARLRLGMSGEEFVRRWKAGELDDLDHSEVVAQSMLLPLMEHCEG
jgi:hypothetical protein